MAVNRFDRNRGFCAAFALACTVGIATGCSGTEATDTTGSGGSGALGGSAVSGGAGGTAAVSGSSSGGTGAGSSGSAGVATGGASGSGTAGSSSGTTGVGGVGGSAGGAGAGAGGVGGAGAGIGGVAGTTAGGGGIGGFGGALAGAGAGGNAGSSGNAGSAGASGQAGGGGTGGSECQTGQVAPDEVALIGDSWVELPGSQTRHLYELARAAGALPAGESYDDRSVSGSPIATIIDQYRQNRDIKVLIMDGGGIDLFNGGNQAQIDAVVTAFENFLQELATDGNVEHVIYYLYPDIPGVPGDLHQLLKPGMPDACAASPVPCHFLELAPLFDGKPEFIGGDTIHASEAGGEVIAEAVWSLMQEHCVAQ